MIKTPRFVQRQLPEQADQKEEIIKGLGAPIAFVSPKYFYNALGSKLFEAITCVPEYYPTRTEAAIFSSHREAFASSLPHEAILIDLGAGNCKKGAALFDVIHPLHYVAMDISVDFLREALEGLQREHPDMTLSGVGLDFSNDLILPSELELPPNAPKLFFYPGSSISNFTPEEALTFLKQVKALCDVTPGSGILIGVDLVKDKATLEAAYDDILGVTAAFNRNMLLNLNDIIGGNFNVNDWRHVALFNEEDLRIEMHLEAVRAVEVLWDGGSRRFSEGERIHTENSYKWLESGFENVLKKAGFKETTAYMDSDNWFSVIWAC